MQPMERRAVLTLGAMLAAGTIGPEALAQNPSTSAQAMPEIPPNAPKVAMLVYPKMVALDLIGPMTIFNILRFNVQLVWKDKTPVATDIGIPITPTQSFEECPKDLDVLFVPGGILGTIDCMNDQEVCAFLADREAQARWVTGVCTGTLVLAAAGLLRGYKATSHWAVTDLLPIMGADSVEGRVIQDRNRLTGGGVTAGIDFGLTLAGLLKGEEAARRVQLLIEYAPAPPFNSGTPRDAGPELVAGLRKARRSMDGRAREAAEAAAKRLGI